MRVVQIEPGPMPTLTASAPASISALAPSAVAILPAMTWAVIALALDPRNRVEHALGMAMGGVHDDDIAFRFQERMAPRNPVLAHIGGGGNP